MLRLALPGCEDIQYDMSRYNIVAETIYNDVPSYIVSVNCIVCHTETRLLVSKTGLQAWIDGGLIQNVLPDLSRAQAELLISGTCAVCFDQMFGI